MDSACVHRLPFQTQSFSLLTLMLVVAKFANTKLRKNPEKLLKPGQMGTLLKVLSESFPMNTNLTWFRRFSKIFVSLCFGWKQPHDPCVAITNLQCINPYIISQQYIINIVVYESMVEVDSCTDI